MRLTLEVRTHIQKLLDEGKSAREVSKITTMCRSTIYRELKKCSGKYIALEAHENTSGGFKKIDWEIVGKKFHRLTVLEFVGYNTSRPRRTMWKCRCDCGAFTYASRKMLSDKCSPKRPLSCGCVPKQNAGPEKRLPMGEDQLRKYYDLLKFRKINRQGCWEWQGYRQKGKTPKTSWMNRAMGVRKCMYLIFNDTTYEPNPVFSSCGNLKCFHPDHITLERPLKRQLYEDEF